MGTVVIHGRILYMRAWMSYSHIKMDKTKTATPGRVPDMGCHFQKLEHNTRVLNLVCESRESKHLCSWDREEMLTTKMGEHLSGCQSVVNSEVLGLARGGCWSIFHSMAYMKCHILKRQKQEKRRPQCATCYHCSEHKHRGLTGRESCSRCPGPCSPALWFSWQSSFLYTSPRHPETEVLGAPS